MKITTITGQNLRKGMIMMFGNSKFYITECGYNNDDTTVVRGNFYSFKNEPTATVRMYDTERVKIVIEE